MAFAAGDLLPLLGRWAAEFADARRSRRIDTGSKMAAVRRSIRAGAGLWRGVEARWTWLPPRLRCTGSLGSTTLQGGHFARDIENLVPDTPEFGLLMAFGLTAAWRRRRGKDAERLNAKMIVGPGVGLAVDLGEAAIVDRRKRDAALMSWPLPSLHRAGLSGPALLVHIGARSTKSITPQILLHSEPQPALSVGFSSLAGSMSLSNDEPAIRSFTIPRIR